jgi:hypothetical protein
VSFDWGFDQMIAFQFMLWSDKKSMTPDFDVEAVGAFSHIAQRLTTRFPK